MQLLTAPGQMLDLDRDVDSGRTILHLGMTRLVKELVRRGADIDVWDYEHHTPLCKAAMHAYLPSLRFLLQQYQAGGASDLERAMIYPCRNEDIESTLLRHVENNSGPTSVATARYLVKELGADLWRTGPFVNGMHQSLYYLPVHAAAALGSRDMVAFFIDECDIQVDTPAPHLLTTPLHAACCCPNGADSLSVVRYLVEKGADITLQDCHGETAAQNALDTGNRQCHALLARRAKRAVVAIDETQLAEKTRAAEAAAQALLDELAAEETKEEAKKQAKKTKKAKAKSKKHVQAMAGETSGGAAAAAPAAAAVAQSSVASLTAATGRLALDEEVERQRGEGGR